MIRVAHVVEAMHQGGAESLVIEHVRLAAPDVHSTVIALNRGGPALEAAGAGGAETLLLQKGGAKAQGLLRLARELRERRIDVVNAHNPIGAVYGTLAARMAGVPVVVRTEHSIHYPGRGGRLYGMVEPWLTGLSDRVICVCEASRESHVSRLGNHAHRFVTILNGIAADADGAAGAAGGRDRMNIRASLGVVPGEPLALTVGSLTVQKSQDVMLRGMAVALERVPNATLLIAGEGRLRDELLALHAQLGLGERVRFIGARLDVPELMHACDLFVLSSSREGLSVTLLEAMRAGRATLATAIGGNPEAVADGVNGRIVPGGDPAAFGAALADMLSDPRALAEYGAAGERRWRERFTAERMVGTTEVLYREALAARGAGRNAA
ncbi:MAG: glycosyltransferase family 4 protein [Candidatus Eisenbacteria bacterium]|nr:glycosyltransferase family 4 protein [Candidatus Eisenbacteria bacterium]